MQPQQEPQYQLRDLKFSVQNIAKIVDWTKKSYLWEFEFKSLINPSAQWSPVRIQFIDSINSGKRTVIVNGKLLLEGVKVNNFAHEPYTILESPIQVKIWKHCMTSALFKGFDLLIQGSLFSDLYAQFQAKYSNKSNSQHSSASNNNHSSNYQGALSDYHRIGTQWQTINNHKSAANATNEFKFNFQTNGVSQRNLNQYLQKDEEAPQMMEDFFNFHSEQPSLKRSLTMAVGQNEMMSIEEFFAGNQVIEKKPSEQSTLNDLMNLDLSDQPPVVTSNQPNTPSGPQVKTPKSTEKAGFKPDPFMTNRMINYAPQVPQMMSEYNTGSVMMSGQPMYFMGQPMMVMPQPLTTHYY